MPIIQNSPKFSGPRQHSGNPLFTAAKWLAHKSISRKSEQSTTDIVATLLSHGARAWRISQPKSQIALRSYNPNGYSAVRLRVK